MNFYPNVKDPAKLVKKMTTGSSLLAHILRIRSENERGSNILIAPPDCNTNWCSADAQFIQNIFSIGKFIKNEENIS